MLRLQRRTPPAGTAGRHAEAIHRSPRCGRGRRRLLCRAHTQRSRSDHRGAALADMQAKLSFLSNVGLDYLSLSRSADTLSGGEAQRIRLATQLGARLTGTIYVLDEPTIGLHQRDTQRLLGTLTGLRDLGNTLVVVEHDPDVIKTADHVIDMGPAAGEFGGEVVASGTWQEIANAKSPTGEFLSGERTIPLPLERRTPKLWIDVDEAHINNPGFSTRIPRRCLTAVTGVSGSGKSSFVMGVLAPLLEARRKARKAGPQRVVVVDQRPIGRTPRSTPASYTKALDGIRKLFASTQSAQALGYGPGRFTYNSREGWCPHCEGRGAILVEMHFLSDVWVKCEHCNGARFSEATLQVRWNGMTIGNVLQMSVTKALAFFSTTAPSSEGSATRGRRPRLPEAGTTREHPQRRRGPASWPPSWSVSEKKRASCSMSPQPDSTSRTSSV